MRAARHRGANVPARENARQSAVDRGAPLQRNDRAHVFVVERRGVFQNGTLASCRSRRTAAALSVPTCPPAPTAAARPTAAAARPTSASHSPTCSSGCDGRAMNNAARGGDVCIVVWQARASGSATSDQHMVDIQPDLHGPVKVATGQGFIRARPEDVLNMIVAVERRPEWDDLCDYASQVRLPLCSLVDIPAELCCVECRMPRDHFLLMMRGMVEQVKKLGEQSDIVYLSYQGKLGVCARDLCLLRAWQERPDGSTVLVAHSIECEDVPRVAGKVRAECQDCAYVVTPAEDGCIFSYVIQLDMKGYVPLFFSNLIQTQHPLIIIMLRRYLEECRGASQSAIGH